MAMPEMLMQFLYPPPASWIIWIMSVMSFVSLTNGGLMEIKGNNMKYAKFLNNVGSPAKKTTEQKVISSKTGMLIAYVPALTAGLASFLLLRRPYDHDQGLRFQMLQFALIIHFFKRVFEVLFVHRFSSGMEIETTIIISLSYFSSTATMIYTQHLTSWLSEPPIDLKFVGIAIFVTGIVGNFYHHYLLSKLRSGGQEIVGNHLKYSKFAAGGGIKLSSRTGMLLLYSPASLAGLATFFIFPGGGIRFLLLKLAVTIHFSKRVLETLFVHKYSGVMMLDSAIIISSSYCFAAAAMIYIHRMTLGVAEPLIDLKYLGVFLFLVGIFGNFYHHLLLANLRANNEKGYKIPTGGLFDLVVCPHYLFEIIGFIGISFISQTLFSYTCAVGVALYLIGRSYTTRKWYISKFDNFPQNVKALIPFVF
ncbi:OLC1v1026465C1 [Oldenlandia corymbosa var. corymbosa]|uniref:OLC1v1026465C1 n=1 Tax=Oldenlandia corymbosa var. corymbosa TaxID=529605 RepID=A0AAV1C7W2_OLDCO|nr:OLC1v1026465C1 [Oldenlandia corymbosa var. corymbosa]